MEKHNGPFVPPEAGPALFRKMREAVDKVNSPAEQLKVEKPPQPSLPNNKKTEKGAVDTPAPEKAMNFKSGARAMSEWQNEQEAREEKRWDKAA